MSPIEKINYLSSIFLKQTSEYDACSSKVSTLATINAIFIGATILFISSQNISLLAFHIKILVIFMIAAFLFSLIIMIWNIDSNKLVKPKMTSDEIEDVLPNHRAIIGIKNYRTVKEYEECISNLTNEKISQDIIKQIFYMNRTILRIGYIMKISVFLNTMGIIIFMILLCLILLT